MNTDLLKLENQLCFPLYACAKEVIKKYRPFLSKLDLTYTQYIAMLILWENGEISVKELGKKLFLDSGTLTPLLKKLESKEYIKRVRSENDERILLISLTEKGSALKEKASEIPEKMSSCVNLNRKEAETLYMLLYKLLDNKTS
ncbi:MAG TPA: MarR family transcriptional regulator [Lachnospiraceae bacterium]|nr:MarR family transcriptional regulator [Lachnospiraceae bacterium]